MTLFSSADADCNNHSHDDEYSPAGTNQCPLENIIFVLFVLQVADECIVVVANHHLQIHDCNSRRVFPDTGGGTEGERERRTPKSGQGRKTEKPLRQTAEEGTRRTFDLRKRKGLRHFLRYFPVVLVFVLAVHMTDCWYSGPGPRTFQVLWW